MPLKLRAVNAGTQDPLHWGSATWDLGEYEEVGFFVQALRLS